MTQSEYPTILVISEFLGDSPRNRDSATLYATRAADLGYRLRTNFAEPEGCTKTRCAGPHPGFAGSEHYVLVDCICGESHQVYPSHMRARTGANPKPPSRARGCALGGKRNAEKRAAVYRAAGLALPAWDTDAAAHAVPAATGEEHQAAEETAAETRTEAATDAAKSRPAPKPARQPPKPAQVPAGDLFADDAAELDADDARAVRRLAKSAGLTPRKAPRRHPEAEGNGPAALRALLRFDI